MITLKEPIQLKNKTVNSIGDGFCNRIRANYDQISASIEPDDLLHIVTQPAEVFYAEGNQTSIFNRNIKIENVNEQKLDIVNQLINRILVSSQASFTYQDRVYISTMLRKLGIRDEKNFMHYVSQMMEEHQSNTKELRELTYRLETLREKMPEVMEGIKKRSEDKATDGTLAESKLYLAESIYNRLQTDRVYDTVWNFNQNLQNEQIITQKEISISEQKRSSTHIKLNNLAMNIVGSPVEMVHVEAKTFEEPSIENITSINEEEIRKQLIESSLFYLIQEVYESRSSKIDQGISNEFNVTHAMFESAGNHFTRYVENIVTPVVEQAVAKESDAPVVRQVLNYLEQQTVTEVHEETIINELEQVSRQNIENQNQYLRVMQQLKERTERRSSVPQRTQNRSIQESLDALDNPVTLLQRYQAEQEEVQSRQLEEREMMLEAYPERVRPLLNYIDRIVSGQVSGTVHGTDSMDALSALNADIAQIELQHRVEETPLIIEGDVEKTQVVERLVEQIKGSTQGRTLRETVEHINQIDRNLQLVHKQTETIDEEQILERIDELRNETREARTVNVTENSDIVTNVNRESREEHITNETVTETEIADMVRQHVISQMGDLSDRVYSRIEKKLQNEKIRRGF